MSYKTEDGRVVLVVGSCCYHYRYEYFSAQEAIGIAHQLINAAHKIHGEKMENLIKEQIENL